MGAESILKGFRYQDLAAAEHIVDLLGNGELISVAIEDPEHVRIAATILGHHSLATTQQYYDQSRMLAAGRHYQSALAELRGQLDNFKGTT